MTLLRRTLSLAVAAAVAVALVPVAPPSAEAAPSLRDPSPPPGAVVAGPEVEVRVRVDGAADGGAQVRVGETELSARRDSGWVIASGEVPAGHHMVRVELDGASRGWRIAVSHLEVRRLAGEDRNATAAAIARETHPEAGEAPAAVLARNDDFADGLAGAPLAHAAEGPLLLTGVEALPSVTAEELERVLAPEATVYLLGGEAAISTAVAEAVADLGVRVERLWGPSRHATAVAIAEELARLLAGDADEDAGDDIDAAPGGDEEERTEETVAAEEDGADPDGTVEAAEPADGEPANGEPDAEPADGEPADGEPADGEPDAEEPVEIGAPVLVSGRSAADALAVAGAAAAAHRPILLTEPDELPRVTGMALTDLREEVLVVGGPAAVSDEVAALVRTLAGGVDRVAGPTRHATAVAVAEHFDRLGGPVALADGGGFVDALAGGPHAAAHGLPLLLAGPRGLPTGAEHLHDEVVVYGGPGALSDTVVEALHVARMSQGSPGVREVAPADGATVTSLPRITATYDEAIDARHSTLYVTLDGTELRGSRSLSDDGRTLRFEPSSLSGLAFGRTYDLEVSAVASTGDGTFRHHAWSFTYRTPVELGPGDRGDDVRALQRDLRDAGYWLPSITGTYDAATRNAVIAFQKAKGLPRSGEVDERAWRTLQDNPAPPSPRSSSGRVLEIDLRRDTLTIAIDGRARWVFHVSTGRSPGFATTPGRHRITRQIDGYRHAPLGTLYRPKYFYGGIAIHGYPSVPTYSASSGCVRIANRSMDFLWSSGLAPVGTPVWVYPHDHYR